MKEEKMKNAKVSVRFFRRSLSVGRWKKLLLPFALFVLAFSAQAEMVDYRDYDARVGAFTNAVHECAVVTEETRELKDGWYAVMDEIDITAATNIVAEGDVHLILRDGASLTVTNAPTRYAAISVGTNSALTIYGQTAGTGRLTAKGGGQAPAIGGSHIGGGTGAVTIHGGIIVANGGANAAAIGGCNKNDGGSVTITGGRIAAAAKSTTVADIGNGASAKSPCTVSISGGVFASPVDGAWCAEGYVSVLNPDPATAADFPHTVIPGWTVTVGEHPHLVVACTFGDGSVTSVVSGVSFGAPKGTENFKVIFTAESGWETVGESAVELGTVTGDITFGEESGYKMPRVRRVPVQYVDADGVTQTRTGDEFSVVTDETRALTAGWHVVLGDVVIGSTNKSANLTVEGDVHLILCDGASLTVTNTPNSTAAISVGDGASLAIYGQSADTGRLTAEGGMYGAGIGGGLSAVVGSVAIHGGTVHARGGNSAACIGSGLQGNGGSVTITDGRISARYSSASGSVLGNGNYASDENPCEVTISGGFFAGTLLDEWIVPGYVSVTNANKTTGMDYPWMVVPRQCMVTIGDHPHVAVAWTGGDGAVTNAVDGKQFMVKGMDAIKVIFTAESGFVLEGDAAVDVDFGDESEVGVADAVPKAIRWNAVVTVASAKQRWPWNGKVDVDYALSNTVTGEYYRLVTAVTVGGATKAVTNEIGAVADGNYTTTVDCTALFGKDVLAPASVTMAVMAHTAPMVTQWWKLSGQFLIIDLGGEDGNGAFKSKTYETADKLPEGAWNFATGWAYEYKTRYLVMRKVKAGLAYPCEPDKSDDVPVSLISRMMTPTNDYWIGVHQVTQEQYARVMGEELPTTDQTMPKVNIGWNDIRGSKGVLETPGGFMSALSIKTLLDGFDLPTEVQWEIAARAGSKEVYGSYVDADGKVRVVTRGSLGEIAWYGGNNTPGGIKAVGQKLPNLWGLYDTVGNVQEWCRDVYVYMGQFDRQDVETPSAVNSSYRVYRGAQYGYPASYSRPSYRGYGDAGYGHDYIGFRASRTCRPEAQDE